MQREWKVSLYLYSNEDPEIWMRDYLNRNEDERVEVTSVHTNTTGCGRDEEEN